jgi:hypothetical protein
MPRSSATEAGAPGCEECYCAGNGSLVAHSGGTSGCKCNDGYAGVHCEACAEGFQKNAEGICAKM